MSLKPCELIRAGLGELFDCTEVNGYIRIRTPFLYPDGDVIDLFLRDDGKFHTLTDLGETTRWLRGQTASEKRTAKQSQLIDDICVTLGLEFFRGALALRVSEIESFNDYVIRLGQGCVRVADIWFTYRSRAIENTLEEVAELLQDNKIPFERNEKKVGRSARTWNIDFHTHSAISDAYIHVLTTGARGTSHRLAEHAVAMWHDLSHISGNYRFVSLFDDTVDVWDEKDISLVSDISDVKRWSRPDELIEAITV